MHRKNKPTSVPSKPKSMIVGSIKSNSNQTRTVGLNLVVFIVCFIFIGVPLFSLVQWTHGPGAADACVGGFFLIFIARLVYISTE